MNDKRKKFIDDLSIENFGKNDHLSVHEFGKGREDNLSVEQFGRKRVTAEKNKRTYKSNTKLSNKKPNRKLNKKFILALGAAGIAGLAVFGGCRVFMDSQKGNNGITIEEALNNKNTLETLGLDENTAKSIEELKDKIENIDSLSDEEIQNLMVDVKDQYLDTVKDKLANVYDVDSKLVQILPENDMADPDSYEYDSRQLASVIVNGQVVAEGDQIPKDLKNYFKECEYAQTNVNNYVVNAEENYNRENAIEALKEDMTNIEKMGSTEITLNEDGSLSTYLVTVKDVDNNKQEQEEDMDR